MKEDSTVGTALGCLFFAYAIRQVLHEQMSECQGVRHDEKVCSKLMILGHEEETKVFMSQLAQILVALLALARLLCMDVGLMYYATTIYIGCMLWFMILVVNLGDQRRCLSSLENGN